MNKKSITLLTTMILFVVVVAIHNVPKKVSKQDAEYLAIIFGGMYQKQQELSFDEEIDYIDTLINHLHQEYMLLQPIDYSESREPQDLHENNGGVCYDFSRSIEKQLMLSGFQTRHVAVYKQSGGFFKTILSPGVFSHSLTEVKTKKGWMIIDSNVPFYAQDKYGNIFDYKHLVAEKVMPNWRLSLDNGLEHFYTPDVVYVYGLYSRHGRFYPPYNFVPDYNFKELFYNF